MSAEKSINYALTSSILFVSWRNCVKGGYHYYPLPLRHCVRFRFLQGQGSSFSDFLVNQSLIFVATSLLKGAAIKRASILLVKIRYGISLQRDCYQILALICTKRHALFLVFPKDALIKLSCFFLFLFWRRAWVSKPSWKSHFKVENDFL